MRVRFWALLLTSTLAAMPASAQETRGNINGTVEDATGVIPGATVRITNVDNSQTQQLVTNSSGYFEAPLLPAAQYRITVEMPSFKTLTQSGITLSVGQTLSVKLRLEVGQVSERVDVTAEAPLLDTTSVSSGQNFDRHLIEGLPMFSGMPIMLTRFAPGVAPSNGDQLYVAQGFVDGTTSAAGGSIGGVGSNNFTIDGATNAGNNRRIATSPNADMIQEMRVETSNFDASIGHGAGNTIAMMTRAGSNTVRGTGNYQYWTNRLNSLNIQQAVTFKTNDFAEREFRKGRSHNLALTLGGPLVIPKVVDGRGKLFFFGNFSKSSDRAPGKNAGTSTIPYGNQPGITASDLDGDFSLLLQLPGGTPPPGTTHSQYQIYDPLTVRVDTARSTQTVTKYIRDPFPGNIIPKNRIMNADGSYKNPLFGLYRAIVPAPNQNFLSASQQPTNNYYRGGEPDSPSATVFGGRIDYNQSENSRFFFRGSGSDFIEPVFDWTYESPNTAYRGLHSTDKARQTWSFTGNWTKVAGATVLDSQLATNHFFEQQLSKAKREYTPSDLGLPAYMDDFCNARGTCLLPVVNIGGYQTMSGGFDGGVSTTNVQGQSNLTSVRGAHTVRAGLDLRLALRSGGVGGNTSGSLTFNNTYTRAADTTTDFVASNTGLSLAALMLGIPSTVSIEQQSPVAISNHYYAGFAQDTWRLNRNFTVNAGLRFEYEDGIAEKDNRMLVGFDPNAVLAITQMAQAAYTANPIPEVPASQFRVLGGSLFASSPGQDGRSWKGQAMWMPRFSAAYKLGEKTVLKGGWGLYYDTLNAGDFDPSQTGYNVTTTSTISTDFGQTWNFGDPRNGISPLTNPFPVRSDGTRFDVPIGDSLGVDTVLGSSNFGVANLDREHSRVQRWRLGVQRELSRNLAVEVAYSGSYADRAGQSIVQNFVPEAYYNSSNVRDNAQQTFLQTTFPNPFRITNFSSLQSSNPALFSRLNGMGFFTSATIQRQRLLRAFPQMDGNLNYNDLPLRVVKSHALEISVNRRFSNGLSGNASVSMTKVTENRTVEDYDRAPTLWQTNQNGRPYRLITGAVYELPFGAGRAFANNGGWISKIVGNWQTGITAEYQPGNILNWNNLFFYGDLKDIQSGNPQIALQPDGSTDLTKTWFNVDAGFERDSAKQPAGFQKRTFPFRVDGVRGTSFQMINMNIGRNFDLGTRRTLQFRVDVQNLLDHQHWGGPNMDPTNQTNFGRITGVSNTFMRFIQFVSKVSF